MKRMLLGLGLVGLVFLAFAGSAQAQYGSGYHSHGCTPGYGVTVRSYPRGHFDFVPAHVDVHRGHLHFVPAHVDYHIGGRRHAVVPGPFGGRVISPYHHHHD